MPTELDWARLAAYIDGEGCISIYARKPTVRDISVKQKRCEGLIVSIRNTDPRLPVWCRDTFGGTIGRSYPKPPRRFSFLWVIRFKKAAGVLEQCMPFFLIKRQQAEIALTVQSTLSKKYGRRGVPEVIREQRRFLIAELRRLKHSPLDHLYKPN